MKISIKTYCTNTLLFILLMWFSHGHADAQTIHIQVDVDASNLHIDTESVKVLCVLENEQEKVGGYAKLRVKNARARDTVQVPITIAQDINKYETISCGLQVCKKGYGDSCQLPLRQSQAITSSEGYRAYDESERNILSARQSLSDLNITLNTSSNSDVIGETNNGPMDGTDVANFPHTITINKSGAALGRMFAQLNNSSIAAICLSDCTTATSDAVEHGKTVTIGAYAENPYDYQFGDDYAVFSGWEGDAICAENANGRQTSFPLNDDVTCTARFDLVPVEMVTITLKKVSSIETKGDGKLVAIVRNSNGSERVVADCPIGCNEVTSAPLPVGTSIVLRQYGSDGLNKFIGWTEDQDCSNSIRLESNTTCSAIFNKVPLVGPTLTLIKTGDGNGVIEAADLRCGLDCTSIVVNMATSSFDFSQRMLISRSADKYSRFDFEDVGENCFGGSGHATVVYHPVITQDTTCFVRFTKKIIDGVASPDLQLPGFTLGISKRGPTRGELEFLFENEVISRCRGAGICDEAYIHNHDVGVGLLELDGTKTITIRAYTHSWTVELNDNPLDTAQMRYSVEFTHFSGDELCTAGVNPEQPNETTIPMRVGNIRCLVHYDYPPPEPEN